MERKRPLQSVPDDELLHRLAEILRQSRRVEADLVAHIGEVEERKLYAREASPSMFVYCTEVLHLSEAEAYLRITVARASRKHPVLLSVLEDGRLHLTGIALLAPHLTRENLDVLLKRATHRSKRQVQELIAEIAPRRDVPAGMRKLPQRRMTPPPAPSRGLLGSGPSVELLPDGVTVRTGCREHHPELVPDGVAAPASAPRPIALASPSSRYIPAAVRRAVHERDGDRCGYVDRQGRRCPERGRLEYHHRHPFALGGDRSLINISLMCHAHNQYLAEHDYGRAAMARNRHSRNRASKIEKVALASAGTAFAATRGGRAQAT
jgi:hypothetical protein